MVQYRFAFKKGFILNYAIQQKTFEAALAQLGERQTEDLKAPCSIHGGGIVFFIFVKLKMTFLGVELPKVDCRTEFLRLT